MTTDLWRMSAMDLAKAIRSGQTSSLEVIEAHMRRIDAVNPAVNAVTVVLGEQALDAAKAADRAVVGGGDLPPLHGVPVTIKETIDLVGYANHARCPGAGGCVSGPGCPPSRTNPCCWGDPDRPDQLSRLRVRWHTDSELWGATVNPWDRSRTPGGSSGGEAAALATGMTALGLGNDLGGSLRWPAQCCGIAALKPTLGRIPRASSIEPVDAPISTQLMLVEGPMARRVADLRTAFEAMAGASWRDPWSVPAPLRGPEPVQPVRVALVVDPAGQGTAEQVQDGVRKAASALDDAGYAVDEVEPPSIAAAAQNWLDILGGDFRPVLQIMAFPWGADTERFVSALFELAPEPDPLTSVQTFVIRQSLLRVWSEFQEKYPLIVAPTFTDIPFEVGKDLTHSGLVEIVRGMRMAVAINALGLPAVALPVGIADGLPQSVQVIGPRYREDLCLDAAAALEDRIGSSTPIDPR
jgi:amidase